MSGDDEMWTPSKVGDNDEGNPRVIANHLRALTREMHDGFDRMGRALEGLARIESRLDVIVDRQNHQDAQITAIHARLDALESKGRKPRKK